MRTRVGPGEHAHTRSLLRGVVAQMPAVLWTVDMDLRFTSCCGDAIEAAGIKPKDVVGLTISEFFGNRDPRYYRTIAHRRALSGESVSYDSEYAGHFFKSNLKPLRDKGHVVGAVGVGLDVTESRLKEEREAFLAHRDILTRLPNRTLLSDRLSLTISRAQRDGKIAAIIFIDLDNFKEVNDRFGHAVGDQLLKAVAVRLTGSLRSYDTVSRTGGDEFIVVASDLPEAGDAELIMQKINELFVAPFSIEGQSVSMSASIGLSVFPTDGINPEDLIRNADRSMYRAKRSTQKKETSI
ncbi:MAG: GGDEF domain-containing protein [Candidatus Eremiobacteraeota bacterium]|nr:GGDEF domain-containing protein [Candidatus Eremiobacteraeota bacterium]MBC5826860.1 GGDEF domain-containing protein [Candidatus Eremiobacteraeota bacterium]